jgi:hypothetical protein
LSAHASNGDGAIAAALGRKVLATAQPRSAAGEPLALAISRRAFLVTGDQHLLGLRHDLPILPPTEFVTKLYEAG